MHGFSGIKHWCLTETVFALSPSETQAYLRERYQAEAGVTWFLLFNWKQFSWLVKLPVLCYVWMWKLPRTQSDCKWRMESTLWTSPALWVEGVCRGQLKFLSVHCANVWHFSMSCYQFLQTLQLVCWFDNSKFSSTWGCPKCFYLVTVVFSWTSLKTERLWSPFCLMLS